MARWIDASMNQGVVKYLYRTMTKELRSSLVSVIVYFVVLLLVTVLATGGFAFVEGGKNSGIFLLVVDFLLFVLWHLFFVHWQDLFPMVPMLQ